MQDASEIILSVAEEPSQRDSISNTGDARNSPNLAVDEEKLHQQLKVGSRLPAHKVAAFCVTAALALMRSAAS